MQGTPEEYKMGGFEELVHYDIFYERVLDERHTVCGISGRDICMDLSNMKTSAGGKQYVITNEEFPYEEIASFGLTLRPICLNALEEIPGDQLHLYRLDKDEIRPWQGKKICYLANRRRLKYENYDTPWRTAFRYAFKELFGRIKDVISKDR
jgi:hypothetical protein